ncbi:MAG: PAS domain S-box protein [Chloroflexota bacterium]|nr:PAS domain S-box protein [Chloroflexota bacterium]
MRQQPQAHIILTICIGHVNLVDSGLKKKVREQFDGGEVMKSEDDGPPKDHESWKQLILDSISELVIYQDRHHRILWANRATCESAGLPLEQITGRYCYEVRHQQNEPCAVCPNEKIFETSKPEQGEIHTADGKLLRVRGYPVRDEHGIIIGTVEVSMDITEQKELEEALHKIEEFGLNLLTNLPNPVVAINPDRSVRYVNPALEKLIGFPAAEIVGTKPPFPWWPERSVAHYNDLFENAVHTGAEKSEQLFKNKNGNPFWVEITSFPVIVNGEPGYYLSSWTDITERKWAEQALRESEHKYRELVERASDGITILQDQIVKYANTRSLEILGYPPEEIIGHPISDYIYPDELANVLDRYTRRMAGESIIPIYETAFLHKDGRRIDVELNAGLIMYEGFPADMVIVRDITERKQAEQALRESEHKYRELVELSNDIVAVAQDGIIKFINTRSSDMLGYAPEEIIGNSMYDYIHPDALADLKKLYAQHKSGEYFTPLYETAIVHADGRRLDVELSVGLITYEGYAAEQVTIRDITKRKQAEKALQESVEFRDSLLANSPNPILVIDPERAIKYVNPAMEELSGYSSTEIVGSTPPYPWWPVEGIPMFHLFLEDAMHYGAKQREFLFKNKRGEPFWVEITSAPIEKNGEFVYFLANWVDITQRKQAELALQQSEQKYRFFFDTTLTGTYVTGFGGEILAANEAGARLLGYNNSEELIGRNILDFYKHQDVRDTVVLPRISGGSAQNFELELVRADGTDFIALVSMIIVELQGKRAILSSGMDITERKQLEESIRHLNSVLRAIRDVNQVIVREMERDNLIQTVCQRLIGSRGYYSAWVILLDEAGGITTTAECCIDDQYIAMAEQFRYSELPNCFRIALEQSNVVVIADPQSTCTDCSMLYTNKDNRGRMTVCMGYGGKIYGLLSVSIPSHIIPDDEESSLLKEVATDIAFALHKMELEEAHSQAQETIAESEAKYRTIINCANDAIIIAKGLNFVFANSRVDILGYTPEEFLKFSFEDVMAPQNAQITTERHLRRIRGERVEPTYEVDMIHRDGHHVPIEMSNTVIDYEGELAVLIIGRDITERRRTEEERKRIELQAQVTGRLASVGEMASGIAHEINNPLTSVIGFAQLLLQQEVPEAIKADLITINEGAQQVSNIVRRLLTFSRQNKPERAYIDINDVLATTLAFRSYNMKTANINLVTDLASDLPFTLADAGQLQQAFLNIIINAETEMKSMHGRGNLWIKTERIDDYIRVSFADDGPGIAENNLERIFEPFFSTRAIGEGTGLGLSICHGIVAEHNGKIYAESQLGKGTTFVVELPLVTEIMSTRGATQAIDEAGMVTKAQILVVDDEPTILQFLDRVLSDEGYLVETIDSSVIALERLESETYDLILLDIKMPFISGIELYERLQITSPLTVPKVVFITGDVIGVHTSIFLSKTKADYFTKPFDTEKLKQDIRNILNRQDR